MSFNQLLNHVAHHDKQTSAKERTTRRSNSKMPVCADTCFSGFKSTISRFMGRNREGSRSARHPQRKIFGYRATPLNVNFADFGNKTPLGPRHIVYQSWGDETIKHYSELKLTSFWDTFSIRARFSIVGPIRWMLTSPISATRLPRTPGISYINLKGKGWGRWLNYYVLVRTKIDLISSYFLYFAHFVSFFLG